MPTPVSFPRQEKNLTKATGEIIRVAPGHPPACSYVLLMRKHQNIRNTQHTDSLEAGGKSITEHVNADSIGATYGVSGRYVLKLAAEGRIPCLRLGKKCVRFDPKAVALALEEPRITISNPKPS